ncbi:MAG: hypothetical protein WKF84_08450 [Pyrinomonadaceae bacterium]
MSVNALSPRQLKINSVKYALVWLFLALGVGTLLVEISVTAHEGGESVQPPAAVAAATPSTLLTTPSHPQPVDIPKDYSMPFGDNPFASQQRSNCERNFYRT